MAIAPELRAQILRLYQAERWRVGTIARQLHVHRGTVQRVLAASCVMRTEQTSRPSRADAYLPFILETLAKFPALTASRLHAMVCERGYVGGSDHFRHIVARHRPRPPAEAYLRLRTLPGEQAQVDWGHFGHVVVGQARRPLMAFVMVLSYSRRIFLRFFLNARMDSFLRGHVDAFFAAGGVARVLLYDNLKSAVLERVGDAIRFNPELLAFAAHHRYEPRPVAVARGNEKGRVERSIRFHPGQLLRRPQLHRCGRSQRTGPGLVRGPGGRSALARGQSFERARGLRNRTGQPDGLARTRLSRARTHGGAGAQDALRAI